MGAVTHLGADDGHVSRNAVPLRADVRADFRAASRSQRILLGATVGWLAYEWGFGNETLTPWLLVRVIAATDAGWSVVAAGVVGLLFTTLQQLASGFTAAAGFSMFRRTARGAWRGLRTRLDTAPRTWAELPPATRALLVFTLGTTAVVLIEMSVTGEVGVGRHRRVVIQSAVLCGVMVGAIGAIVASAVWLGRSVPALAGATDWLLRILGNPLFWIGLLVLVLVVDRLRSGGARAELTPAG